jgi:transglutaminase-like putative cysteine protease
MSADPVTDEFAQQVADDLRTRYALDEDNLRALGAKLAAGADARRDENIAFADRFTSEHADTFNRLAQ